jgi:photosystem II stability/assembly factor-like uncharacterized protein
MKSIFSLVFLLAIISNSFSQSAFDKNPIPFTSAKDRLESYQKKIDAQKNSLFKNVEFRSVGPTVMSGRVVDINVNPADPTIFYVAYASGGLWKTTNNGISFSPLFDNESVISIGAIAVDWKNNIIYVGTGENNSSRSSYSGTGIYKSTNDGKEWFNTGLIESHRIGRIVIHPSNPDIIFVAALGHLFSPNPERGIYKSTDAGKSWKQTLFLDENTGGIDLTINPSNPQIIYASMWYRERRAWHGFEAGKTSGIYKSTDGGEKWFQITSKENGFTSGDGVGRIGLALYEKNPDLIYALVDNLSIKEKKEPKEELRVDKELLKKIAKDDFLKLDENDLNDYLDKYNFPQKYNAKKVIEMIKKDEIKPSDLVDYVENPETRMFDTEVVGGEVYKTIDGGNSWKKTNEKYIKDFFYTYGYYFGNIRVSPNNPDKIYLLGVPIIKSEDGGKTFKTLMTENVHADCHPLWINPNREGHMILGNDGGVNITYDDGKTWFKANTPPVGQFYSVNVDMDKPYNVYGGLQDNGAWFGPSTYKAGYDWYQSGAYPYKNLMGGDGMQVAIDTRDNNTVYTGYQFGNYYRINKTTWDYKYITPRHELGEKQFRFNWQSPIMISTHNQDIIYFGSNKLHRSMNKGDNFDVISPDLTNGGLPGKVPFGTLTTIHESPLRFGLIYTGSDDGKICVTRDGGYKWEIISNKLPEHYWISRVQASKFDTGTVYVSLNGFRWDNFDPLVFKSTNYGEDWEQIGLDLPLESVNVIKEDPVNKNILYAGTDAGVYVSINGGKSFMQIFKSLPNVPVHDLVIHSRDNELVIGTHGRSIYVADVQYIQKLTDTLLTKNLFVFDLKETTYNKNWGKKGHEWSEIKDPEMKISFYSLNDANAVIRIKTKDSVLVNKYEIPVAKGLNFYKYNLSVDSSNFDLYITLFKDKVKDTIKTADNGRLYLRPGNYFIEIEIPGAIETRKFEIKEPPKSKRG